MRATVRSDGLHETEDRTKERTYLETCEFDESLDRLDVRLSCLLHLLTTSSESRHRKVCVET